MSESNAVNRITLNRRQAVMLAAGAGVGAALAKPAVAMDNTKTAAHQEPGNCSTPRSAVANTQYGKVRGFVDGGVFTFKGIPYGQNTGGENRWLPAKAPVPWKDEYPALIYGANCPQNLHDFTAIEQSFLQDWDDGWHERRHAQAERLDAEPDRQARRSWCTSTAADSVSVRPMNCLRMKARRWRGITTSFRSQSIIG